MTPLTLGEVAQIVGGRLSDADPATVVAGPVEFDSRNVRPGVLFLALPGERVDGHDYVAAALDAGAVASIVTRPVSGPHVEVTDGVAALTALAAHNVRALPDVTVIGVTGSSGKTSTKDLLAQLLARLGPTVAPPGSFNNELGHPYTVLRADAASRYLVLETSARGIGHIRHLTRIAPPRIGVVLNVGSAHLGEFGSREAIAQAKGELVEALPAHGLAVLNADDPLVSAMAARTSARIRTVGESRGAEVRALDIELDDLGRAAFTITADSDAAAVQLRLVGEHHVGNALAAAAVALECGMPLADVAAALGEATALSGSRMAVTERSDGVLVIDDAYNANPESVRAALKALAALGRSRGARTIAVLGEMAELGEASLTEHDAVGRLAVRLDIAKLIAVGRAARPIAQGAALEGSWADEAAWVPDIDEALAAVRAELTGDGGPAVVLVKASHSVGLQRLAEQLVRDPGDDDDTGGAA